MRVYFLWRRHFPPDKSDNDQDSDSQLIYILYTDIWLLTLLFSLKYLSESCFENDNTFLLYPTVELFCFPFCLHNPFLFGTTPHPTSQAKSQWFSIKLFLSLLARCNWIIVLKWKHVIWYSTLTPSGNKSLTGHVTSLYKGLRPAAGVEALACEVGEVAPHPQRHK